LQEGRENANIDAGLGFHLENLSWRISNEEDSSETLGDSIGRLFMVTFILVHGTFARAAHWPALRDGLALAVSAVGEDCQFEELRWSGKNKASARQGAASELLTLVQKIQSTSRNEKIFVIGHSHGGSAIAYFLKEYSSLAKTLHGYAFLSTPFVAIRPRAQASALYTAVFFVLIYTFSAFFPYYAYLFGGDYLRNALFILPAGIGLCAAFTWLVFNTLSKFENSEKLLETGHRRQTAELPPGNYLFLRCSGDEAAAALSAAQLIAWLGMKLSQALKLIIMPALSGTRKSAIYLISLGLIVTWWTSFASPGDRDDAIRAFGGPSWIFDVLWLANLLLIVCAAAAFLIFLAQALTSWLFGWTEFFTGFFVELAIEPLPFGAHYMAHIDWADSRRLEGFTHSWTYAHPVAIRYVQDWVKTALQ
jgi:lecithin:cholesterol acyltransferase